MLIRFGFAPRAAGMSHEQFSSHWVNVHGPLIRSMPNIVSYRQYHTKDGITFLGVQHDAVAATYFEANSDMFEAFSSPYYRSVVAPDEERFVDKKRGLSILTKYDGDKPNIKNSVLSILEKGKDEEAFEYLSRVQNRNLEIYPAIRDQISTQASEFLGVVIADQNFQINLFDLFELTVSARVVNVK